MPGNKGVPDTWITLADVPTWNGPVGAGQVVSRIWPRRHCGGLNRTVDTGHAGEANAGGNRPCPVVS